MNKKTDFSNLPPGARYVPVELDAVQNTPALAPPQVIAPPLSFSNKIKSFGMAMASKLLQPAASRAQRRARLAVCAGCDAFKPTKDSRVGFCGACGCGQHKLASLAVKSKILYSTCPQRKWDVVLSLPVLAAPEA